MARLQPLDDVPAWRTVLFLCGNTERIRGMGLPAVEADHPGNGIYHGGGIYDRVHC